MRKRFLLTLLLVFSAVCAFAQPVTINPPSATIQPGGSVTLTASGATYYQWSPATGLSVTDRPETVASPTVTTTYTCTGFAPGAESVVNGDFEQGNVGFTSAYQYNTNLWGEGTYYVDSDASLHHESFAGYGHNGGNFMIVNGATSPGTNVWTEQITVVPNTQYAFSTWACNVSVGDPDQVALLQFSINGVQLGPIFSAPNQLNTWNQFYELWNSGNATTATITILNQNTVAGGNDFGLDDISFRQLVPVGSPTCTVYVGSMTASASADDYELCEGASTTLHVTPVNGSGHYTYSWTPANTLSNPAAQHPVATPPLGSTRYTCHVTDVDWGTTQDASVTVVVHPNVEVQLAEAICANEVYDFFGEALTASGEYEHMLQTPFGCDSLIRLNLTVYPPNDTTIVDPSICVGDSYDFHGTLYNQDGQIAYFDTVDYHGCLKVEKLVLTVDEYQMPPVVHQYECYAHGTVPAWTWDKTGITYHEDTYDEIILDDPNGGCPIRHRLELRFHEEFYQEESRVVCDSYYWPITGETYTESQDWIEKTFHHVFGDTECDSTYVLHLEIGEYETNSFTVPYDESCDSYYWETGGLDYHTDDEYDPEDHVFTQSGTYHRTYFNGLGCDSIVTMNVQFDYTPNPTEIYPMDPANPAPHWVITATEFQINSYDYTMWDQNPYCSWDSVTWNFVEPVTWVLEPFGEKHQCCKVYVLNHVDDTVWIEARAFNRCAPEEGVSQRYWLVCSFYGIEEGDGLTHADMAVSPNPNNGQMDLRLDHLTGLIEFKVYDMTGRQIDQFQMHNDLEYNTIQYNLRNDVGGVYVFVATSKEGVVTKKVVVTK